MTLISTTAKKLVVLSLIGLYFFSPFFLMLPHSQVQAVNAGDSYFRPSRMKEATAPGNVLIYFTTSSIQPLLPKASSKLPSTASG